MFHISKVKPFFFVFALFSEQLSCSFYYYYCLIHITLNSDSH